MHLFKAKVFKLALQSMALAFLVFIFVGISPVEAAKPLITAKDTCVSSSGTSLSAVKVATVNLSSNTTCEVTGLTGFAGGDLNITGITTKVTIRDGGTLVLDPGKWINLNPPKGQIIVETAGRSDAIVHGTLCILDNDNDGYANNGVSYVYLAPNASNNKQVCTVLGANYVEKTTVSTTEYDCYPDDPNKQDCCTTGYRDYDKDGYGLSTDVSACYMSDAAYNVVANNYDCNDSVPGITNINTDYYTCGTGSCAGSGSDACTNGVHTITTCVVSTKLCCDAGGNYVGAQTPINTCLKCNGAAADPVNQTAAEDLGNKCTSSGCQLDTCSGLGDYCGYTASGTTCRGAAGTCDLAETCTGASYTCPIDAYKNNANICSTPDFDNPAIGSCQRTATDQYCSGTATACSGSTANRYEYAGTDGNIWNGAGAWVAANSGNYKSLTSPYTCSGYTTILGSYYGCAAAANVVGSTAKGTKATVVCSGTESDMCISGLSTCTNACAAPYYPTDNNGNGYNDIIDPPCGAQCSSGACCDTSTGLFRTSSYTCNASAGTCDVAENCTGTSATCPMDAFQPNSYVCSAATGSAGSCQISVLKCTGTSNSCSVAYNVNAPTNNNVWNGSSWAVASASNKCNSSSTCSGNTQINNNYFGCAVGSNTCNGTVAGTATVACSGAENQMCIAGNNACVNACLAPYFSGDTNGNGFDDNQDNACGNCGQCTSGTCCNTANGCYITTVCRASAGPCDVAENCTGTSTTCPTDTFQSSSYICSDPGCGAATGGVNSCQTTYGKQLCSGASASCTGSTVGPNFCNPPSSNNIWNGSAWITSNATNYCGSGSANTCNGTQPQGPSYGCNTSGSCGTTANGYYVNKGSVCSGGTPYCSGGACCGCTAANQCGSNGFVTGANTCSGTQPQGTYRTYSCSSSCGSCSSFDAQANYGSACSGGTPYCLNGSCVACQSGSCCNTTTGSPQPTSVKCADGNCSSPSSGSGCTYTYNNRNCNGSETSTCTGSYVASGAVCNCANGKVWDGSTCTTPSDRTLSCGTGSTYSCYSWYDGRYWNYLSRVNTYSCDGSGGCNVSTGYVTTDATCSAPTPVCNSATGRCAECNTASDCGLNALTNIHCVWPNADAQYQTFSCTNGTCSSSLGTVQYHTCTSGEVCAGSYYGIQSVSNLCGPISCTTNKQLVDGLCIWCTIGWWSYAGQNTCSLCPPGSYDNIGQGSGCTICPQDSYCTGGAAIQTCASNVSAPYPQYSPPATTSFGGCTAYPYSG